MTFICSNGQWQYENGQPVHTAPVKRSASPTIPLPVVEEAYKEYAAQYGTSQSLQRLNERGGFGSSEIAILLYERIKRLEG